MTNEAMFEWGIGIEPRIAKMARMGGVAGAAGGDAGGVRERNARLPDGCFRIDEERVKGWVGLFEPPDREELGLDGGGAG